MQITQIVNNRITGALVIDAPSAAADASIGKRAILLPPGRYPFTGTLTPRSYNVAGTINGIPFTVQGLLPTVSLTGTYQVVAVGQTYSGILPKGSITLPNG